MKHLPWFLIGFVGLTLFCCGYVLGSCEQEFRAPVIEFREIP